MKVQITFIGIVVLCLFRAHHSLFFDLFHDYESCFTDEYASETIVIIQFRPFMHYDLNEELKEGHYTFNIKKSENNEIVQTLLGTKLEDKVFFIVKESGNYNICVKGNKASKLFKQIHYIKFSLTIETDDKVVNLPHDDLPDNQNLGLLEKKVQILSIKTHNIIKSQQTNIEVEDKFSEFQLNNSHTLLIMTIVQIVIIVLLFLYTCTSLKNSLMSS